jgi:hypothetical protein
VEAYEGILQLLFANHLEYPLELLSHIFNLINTELTREGIKNTSTVYGIIQFSAPLFSRGIKGVNVLIPVYLSQIGKLVTAYYNLTYPSS